jgi:hypothetical protein
MDLAVAITQLAVDDEFFRRQITGKPLARNK